MRAVVNTAPTPHAVELQEQPVPQIGPDDVLLRVRAVGACGSDIHQWHGTHSWPVNHPVILGHEFAGEIEAVGAHVEGYKPGDRIASETAAYVCGTCACCRSGFYNLCPKRLGFGYGTNGAMAEFVRVPSRCLHRLPADLPFEDAAMAEPACVAAHAVLELCTVRPGDFVVIFGPGAIGLMALQLAALAGPRELWIVGTPRDRRRLAMARDLGATRTLVYGEDDVTIAARRVGDGLGADLVVDASGVTATLKPAMEVVRPMGCIAKPGWGPQPCGFSLDPIVAKGVRIQGSFSHNWRTWERVLALLARGRIRVAPMRGVFPLENWLEGFEAMDSLEVAKSVMVP